MTVPIKCLIPEQHETSIRSSSASKFMVYEFTQFLCHAKEAFLDLNVIRAVLDHLNNCLLLEVLHILCECVSKILKSKSVYFCFTLYV